MVAPSNEPTIRQIDLDVGRTMPEHAMFASGADGTQKLRRILIAYSMHVSPVIGYCQAMNFIAGLLLVVFDGNESNALMGLICIIDHYFPPHYYDHHLTGARADQLLLRDLLVDKINSDANEKYSYEHNLFDEIINSVTLSWFLSLFHNAIPWQTRLFVLDCFWFEGVKVLFRFSLALLELSRSYILRKDLTTGEVVNVIKEKAKSCFDVISLKKTAFGQIKIAKRRHLATRRAFYVKQLTSADLKLKKLETTKEYWRRRSFELFGISTCVETMPAQSVVSCDKTKAACYISSTCPKEKSEIKIIARGESKVIPIAWKQRSKNLFLLGVKNDGSAVVFCRQWAKADVKVSSKGVLIETISVPFSTVAGFYCQCKEEVYIIGSEGVVTKVGLRTRPRWETMVVVNRPAKTQTAAFDHRDNLLWLYMSSPNINGKFQLVAVDARSLDIFNLIDVGTECVSKITCSAGSIYLCSRQENGLTTVSMISSSYSKQIILEDEEIVDCQIHLITDEGPTNFQLAPFRSMSNIIVALFKNGKLFCIETEGNCIRRKRFASLSETIENPATVLSVTKDGGDFIVTIVVPKSVNKIIKVRL